jgi:drug/metabolite transporter (DMT)-like permease
LRALETLAPAAPLGNTGMGCPSASGKLNLRNPFSHGSIDATARLMLVGVSLAWGLTWPALKIALDEIPPFSMRVGTCAIGASALFGLALLQRRPLQIRGATARIHLVIAGCLNVAIFSVATAFAQLATTTSRVAVLAYTMPIWAALFARPVLGERLDPMRGFSLLLCMAGLTVLLYPLLGSNDVIGLALALVTAVTWAAGTVYLKWARIEADPMALAAWQVTVAFIATAVGLLLVEGSPHLWPAPPRSLLALIFAGLAGSAIAYLLWFEVVRRLPAMTASLGVLGSPVVGVIASVLVLGERPTLADVIGFTLILAAAACVLLAPPTRLSQTARIEAARSRDRTSRARSRRPSP